MVAMPLFRRSPAKDVRADLLAWLDSQGVAGDRRILAWASGEAGDTAAYGLAGRLVWRSDDGWHQVPWHEIEHASNDGATGALRFTTTTGESYELDLADSSLLSQLVRERVEATILIQSAVTLGGGKAAVVSARRALVGSDAIIWHVSWPPGITKNSYRELRVQQELDRLQADYDV